MSDIDEARKVGADAMNIAATAAAAFGPPGAPLYILAATLAYVMANDQTGEPQAGKLDYAGLALKIKEDNHIRDAAKAWAKIDPACDDYFSWMREAKAGQVHSTRGGALDHFINEAQSPNSNLREGLTIIYNPDNGDTGVAKYAAQAYILGTSVHVAIAVLGLKRFSENLKEEDPARTDEQVARIVAGEVGKIRRLAQEYVESIDVVTRAAKIQIEMELGSEIAAGMYKIGGPEIAARNEELVELFLGGEDASVETRRGLVNVIAGTEEFLRKLN